MLPGVTENPQWLQVPELAMGWMVLIASWKAFPFYGTSRTDQGHDPTRFHVE